MEYEIKVDEKDHAFHGQEKMNNYRKEGRFCDFIIKVESEEFPVHQMVLSSHSEFFDKMLTHDTQEKQNGFVEIRGVGRECTLNCVDFIYTGVTSIVEDKCVDLMHAATMFRLTPLCDAIADLLVKNLDRESFLGTKRLADVFSNEKLTSICTNFALEHFKEVASLEEFGQLDEEYIKFLLKSEGLKASESVKCKSLINWVKYSDSTRKDHLPGLLLLLNLAKVRLSYRSFLVECEPVVSSSTECMNIVTRSILRSMDVKSKDLSLESKDGICVFDQTSNKLQVLDVEEGTWTPKQAFDLNTMGGGFSAVALDEHLYVFGQDLTVHRIAHNDPDAQWERRANKQLYYGDAVTLNGFIYASDFGNYSQQIERYSPDADKWVFLPNKQLSVRGASLAISEGEIFCIGGYDGTYQNQVEVYDLATSRWNYDSPLNDARYQSSATAYRDGIYVMGGFLSSGSYAQSVEYRCPVAKRWNTVKGMNNPRVWCGSCCIGEKIFAVGGDQSNPQTIEEYDPETKEWKVLERMTEKTIVIQASISIPM